MGQQDIVGQVLSVQGRSTRTNKTIYDVAFSDGNKYTTFDGDLAQKANSLIGQAVSARVEISQNGQYTNYNLKDVAPQGKLAPTAMPLPGGSPIPMAAPSVSAPTIPMVQGDPQKDARIAKGVAVKVAAEITSGLFQGAGPEAVSEALEVFDKVGQHVLGVLTGAQQAVPASPEVVAAQVNEAAGQEVVQTGAVIPWA